MPRLRRSPNRPARSPSFPAGLRPKTRRRRSTRTSSRLPTASRSTLRSSRRLPTSTSRQRTRQRPTTTTRSRKSRARSTRRSSNRRARRDHDGLRRALLMGSPAAPPASPVAPVPPVAATALKERALPSTAQAQAVARSVLDGFNKHYALFRECARAAQHHFDAGNWLAIQHVGRDRIDFYDRRVQETADRVLREFRSAGLDTDSLWEQVKLHFIGLLIDHKQPECAETFFNSVSVKVLHRVYFHNRFIFVRPAISTEHIDAEPPSYKSYYPLQQGLRAALVDIVLDLGFERHFADFRRDLINVLATFRARFPRPFALEANHQIQVLSS